MYFLDPVAWTKGGMGSLCAGCSPQSGLGYVYSLDPFAFSPRGLGNLGLDTARQNAANSIIQGIVAKGDNCNDYLAMVDTYTRLSQKDKSKETIAAAKELVALFQQKYNECVDRKATAAVAPAYSAPVATTTVSPVAQIASAALTPFLTAISGQQPAITQVPVQTVPQQQTVVQQTPAQPTGWMTPRNMLIAGGAVLAIGLVIYMMRRK